MGFAHKAWLARKLEHAYDLATLEDDERVGQALISRYKNYPVQNYLFQAYVK